MSSDSLRWIRGVLGVLLWLAVGSAPCSAEIDPDTFSGDRAMHWLVAQCDLGPRPPGSPELETLRRMIEVHGDSLGLPVQRQCFTAQDPLGGGPVELCNLIVRCGPPGGHRLWLGAHYDTRPICDKDPDPDRRSEPLLGANDGASGVAVLLHLMEILSAQSPSRGVDLIFFDGEDSGPAGDPSGFCLGSRHLAETWNEFSSPLAGDRPRALIVLDMIGARNLRVGMEGYSLRYAQELTMAAFDRAQSLGLWAFVSERAVAVYDDHVPFLQAGIPALDLIDFNYAPWHTTGDVPAACDPASLAQIGRLVVSLIDRPLVGF